MVSSQATTVEDYLKQLPPDRQEVMRVMRVFILEHLPAGYVETISWGLLSYEIPLEVFPKTYNRRNPSITSVWLPKSISIRFT